MVATTKAACMNCSATDATTDIVKAGARSPDPGTDTTKQFAVQSGREFDWFISYSVERHREAALQFSRNLDVLLQVGEIVVSGYRSIVSAWWKHAQRATQRHADMFNNIKARTTHDLLGVPNDVLKDNVQNLPSASTFINDMSDADYVSVLSMFRNAVYAEAAVEVAEELARQFLQDLYPNLPQETHDLVIACLKVEVDWDAYSASGHQNGPEPARNGRR